MDIPIVEKASMAKGELNEELMQYLVDTLQPIEYKIAVINALGWDINGKKNADKFLAFISAQWGFNNIDAILANGNAELLICLAYIKAMDNYFEVEEALNIAQKAILKNTKSSFTIEIVFALIKTQEVLRTQGNFCTVHRVYHFYRNKSNLKMDMRENAFASIDNYLSAYKKHCD
jgi:hypothetical protein